MASLNGAIPRATLKFARGGPTYTAGDGIMFFSSAGRHMLTAIEPSTAGRFKTQCYACDEDGSATNQMSDEDDDEDAPDEPVTEIEASAAELITGLMHCIPMHLVTELVKHALDLVTALIPKATSAKIGTHVFGAASTEDTRKARSYDLNPGTGLPLVQVSCLVLALWTTESLTKEHMACARGLSVDDLEKKLGMVKAPAWEGLMGGAVSGAIPPAVAKVVYPTLLCEALKYYSVGMLKMARWSKVSGVAAAARRRLARRRLAPPPPLPATHVT